MEKRRGQTSSAKDAKSFKKAYKEEDFELELNQLDFIAAITVKNTHEETNLRKALGQETEQIGPLGTIALRVKAGCYMTRVQLTEFGEFTTDSAERSNSVLRGLPRHSRQTTACMVSRVLTDTRIRPRLLVSRSSASPESERRSSSRPMQTLVARPQPREACNFDRPGQQPSNCFQLVQHRLLPLRARGIAPS